MINESSKIAQFYSEWQAMVAIIFGMILQYRLGEKKGREIALTIGISTIFVALYVVPVIIESLNLNPASKWANAIYGLSAIISVEILVLIVKALPKAAQNRVNRFFGVDDEQN